MSFINLNDLPSAPPGKTGWPWVPECEESLIELKNFHHLPKITIITPSYNQGEFIEETIRSVLLQGYPNLEYIIMDGGSTDGTLQIIKKYEKNLAYWTSEKDEGQANAINKGLQKATGEIVAWLNSDDIYLPGTLFTIARAFVNNPSVVLVYGEVEVINEKGQKLFKLKSSPFNLMDMIEKRNFIRQPATFWKREIHRNIGFLDATFSYAFDFDFWIRVGLRYRNNVLFLPQTLALFRLHKRSKSYPGDYPFFQEHIKLGHKLLKSKDIPIEIRSAIHQMLANRYIFFHKRGKALFHLFMVWVLSFCNFSKGRAFLKLLMEIILGRYYSKIVSPLVRQTKSLIKIVMRLLPLG